MQQWRVLCGGAEEALVLMDCVSRLAGPRLYDAAYSCLPRFRQEKADSLLFERDRQLSVGAWLLLEQAFHMEGLCLDDYSIGYSEQGKPYALDCPLRFSISHSGEYAMCAVSRGGEVGCDIQRIDTYDAGFARVCMTPRELNEIEALSSSSQRAHAFCRHWVAKESYVKALGCGLAKDPASFAAEFPHNAESDSSENARILDDALAGTAGAVEMNAPDGYCAAVCVFDRL